MNQVDMNQARYQVGQEFQVVNADAEVNVGKGDRITITDRDQSAESFSYQIIWPRGAGTETARLDESRLAELIGQDADGDPRT